LTELLIDDRGAVWPATSDPIKHRFGVSPGDGSDFVSQSTALGFTFLKSSAAGVLIALQPQIVTAKAVARIAAVLVELVDRVRVGILCHGVTSSPEIVAGASAAIARIEALVEAARNPLPHATLAEKYLSLDECEDIGGGYLSPLLHIWRQREQRWDPDIFQRLQTIGLAEMTAVYRQSTRSEELIIDNWGNNFKLYGDEWPSIARGRNVEDQPNALIGQRHAERLRRILAQGRAELAESEAVLHRIDQTLILIRYVRLTLPWETADGTRIVTGMRFVNEVLSISPAQ
jgi:hypothetical protein